MQNSRAEFIKTCRQANKQFLLAEGNLKQVYIKYLRGKPHFEYKEDGIIIHKGMPYGVMMLYDTPNGYQFGWALCDKKDSFVKSVGLWKAIRRLSRYDMSDTQFPHTIMRHLEDFVDEALKELNKTTVAD